MYKKTKQHVDSIVTKEFLIDQYYNKEKSITLIAKEFNFNRDTVRKRFHGFNLIMRTPSQQKKYTLLPSDFNEKCVAGIRKKMKIKVYLEVNCVICGNKKMILETEHKHGMKHVCSVECWSKLMQLKNNGAKRSKEMGKKLSKMFRTGKYIKCETCGKEKYFPIHKIERNQHYFCSTNCYAIAKEYIYVGDKSSNWIDGRTLLHRLIRGCKKYKNWKYNVLKRDNFTCRDCKKRGGNLEAHHVKPFRQRIEEFLKIYFQFDVITDINILVKLAKKWKDFWDIKNGITYCIKCHSKNDLYRHISKLTEENNARKI